MLIVDRSGQPLGTLKALRETWLPGERVVLCGTSYQVSAVVPLEQPDPRSATTIRRRRNDRDIRISNRLRRVEAYGLGQRRVQAYVGYMSNLIARIRALLKGKPKA